MIKELHKNIASGKITATEITQKCIDAIEEKEEEVGAFLDIYKKEAREAARKVDEKVLKGDEIGPLEGIPCAIKDNICLKGKKTTVGSKILEHYIPATDAFVIKKLKKAGANFIGKTNLDEFAMGSSTENSAFKKTKNPFDAERVPGGSSGGSAAAVAAEMAVWSLGSDTGGSIRQPASFCNCVALKPTYGRVSRSGLIAMASSYDQIGPITKDVEDTAVILDIISGQDAKDNTTIKKETAFTENLNSDTKKYKVGVIKNLPEKGLNKEVKKIFKQGVKKLESAGAKIVEIEIPHIAQGLAVYYLMMPSEVSSNLARYDGIKFGLSEKKGVNDLLDVYNKSREKGFGDEVKRRIILGTYALSAGYYDAYYKKAQKVRELIKQEFKKAFDEVDVIATPTVPALPFKLGEKINDPLEMYLTDMYTVIANVAMLPALSVPAGWTKEKGKKLPIGIQFLGSWWQEQKILNAGKAMEEAS